MDKTFEQQDAEIIELGVASVETKGVGVGGQDDSGFRPKTGLTND